MNDIAAAVDLNAKDFTSDQEIRWCPGCGDYAIVKTVRKALAEIGSMLGSAGVVVLNESVDMAWAAQEQLLFFERESCGQCSPCRIGTAYQRHLLDGYISKRGQDGAKDSLSKLSMVSKEMIEGSICGLGQTASLPLTSAIQYFPGEFA